MKKEILLYLSQILLIVFSVVLGLYLSERIEERKNQKSANELVAKIKAELTSNKELLDYWVPYHGEVISLLDSLSNEQNFINEFIKDKSMIFRAMEKGTIMGALPVNDAWEIAKSHPLIVNMDYDQLLLFSRIYNQQKSTYDPIYGLLELMRTPEFNAKETVKQGLEQFRTDIHEMYQRELQLLYYYEQIGDL